MIVKTSWGPMDWHLYAVLFLDDDDMPAGQAPPQTWRDDKTGAWVTYRHGSDSWKYRTPLAGEGMPEFGETDMVEDVLTALGFERVETFHHVVK